jgi:hypothetical protein
LHRRQLESSAAGGAAAGGRATSGAIAITGAGGSYASITDTTIGGGNTSATRCGWE